jgi:hypothetical protein
MVEQLGVDFGALAGRMPPHPDDNPEGYLEQFSIMRMNDKILKAYGGAWWRPPEMPSGWEHSTRLGLTRRRARRSLRTLYTHERWGFKDPRVSLTLPSEVAASLLHRSRETLRRHPARTLDGPAWSRLWLTYMNAALASTRNLRRLTVCYPDLFRAGEEQVTTLSGFLGLPASETTRRRITAIIEPQLWRHRAGHIPRDEVAVSDEARRLYDLLTVSAGATS